MMDLRNFIDQIETKEELKRLNGLHWDKEMGAFMEIVYRTATPGTAPALLFDRIPGYPEGYRCLYGMLASPRRLGLTMGLDIKENPTRLSLLQEFRQRSSNIAPIPPRDVDNGPILENVDSGAEIDLEKFPVPIHHELDGGRYIGTADAVITRDPDEGWVNLGTYRVQMVSKSQVTCYISPNKDGRRQVDKYLARREVCPIVIVAGLDPVLWLVSRYQVPWGVGELDYAGGIVGEPIEVIKGDYTGLPFPAQAEIVLEGELSPTEKVLEGPFGEWPGYYAGASKEQPVIDVKRVYYRNNPILTCAASQRPPHAHLFERSFIRSAGLWDMLERAGCPGIKGVWVHEAGSGRTFNAISIRQEFYGHSRQAGLIASQVPPAGYANRFTIVVDDDIDPSNLYEVIWAMGTRCDPQQDIDILRKNWSSRLDPLVFGDQLYNSRAIIDACIPYEHRDDFPKVVQTSAEYRQVMMDKFGDLLRDVVGYKGVLI